jgi:hypothetical protein
MSMPTIHPPLKLERWLRGGGYLFVGSVGIYVMLHPPETLGVSLGSTAAVLLWCAFMATGVAAGVMSIMGRFRGEYIMLPFFTGAVGIADVNLYFRAFTENDDGIMTRAMIITALILAYLARYVTLRRLVRIGITLERHGKFWGRF